MTGQPIGRMFRNHVWVSQDGFSSGQLPTTNRVKYLSESGKIPANSPAFSFLPKQKDGTTPANVAQVYMSAKASAEARGSTTCSGDGKDGCSISCSQPSSGWQGQFCAAKTVQHWSCSDSYAVNNGGSWQPTKDATVPFTSSSPQDYSKKTWKWPDIFAWNSPSMGNSGGVVYMCNSTINSCNGWVTSAATYKCRAPATYDCSYSGADSSGRPTSYARSCQTCDPAMGAKWDFQLDQANDCPATPLSTRVANTRLVWQADLAATSCPINGSGSNNANQVRQCPGGQLLDATGTSCACRPGYNWDWSVCQAPPPPGSPPSLIFTPLSFSKGVAYNGVVMGSLSNGSAITSISLPPSASPVPPGMFTHFSGSMALISGIPNTNGAYNFSVKADYAAGVDPSGNRYPAGVTVSGVSATVTGCSAGPISWTQGANACSGSVGNSASVGIAPTIASTSGAPAGAKGSNALACDLSAGSWSSTASSCAVPAPVGGFNLAAFPSMIYEIGSAGAAQIWFSPGGAWRILRANCGNESVPGWSAQGQSAFCKTTNTYGNLLTAGSNSADFEIMFSNGVFTSVRQDRRGRAQTAAYPFGDCASWRDMTSFGSGCSALAVDGANIKGMDGDVPLYFDESLKFTISIRRKSNPADSVSINVTLAESFQSGFVN